MKKQLPEMTLEELWALFPVYLTEYKKEWNSWYEEELYHLQRILPMPQIKRMSHIGSTAIQGIWAKPTVDMLVETSGESNWNIIKNILTSNGYICMSENTNRISFNKGYTPNGFADKVYHLHLRHLGDNDELYFRDYLIEHPLVAKQYEECKVNLWKKHPHHRDAYTDGKADFVKKYTLLAKKYYGNHYE